VTLVGCGVPCAYMISKEKTSTVYKIFIETINNITHGQWRPDCIANAISKEHCILVVSQLSFIFFSLSLSFILFNFFFLSSFSRLFLVPVLLILFQFSLSVFSFFCFVLYIIIVGITEALPGCIVFGCFFHLMQAIVRQIKSNLIFCILFSFLDEYIYI
jgi:hypothetical protein